MNGLLLNVRIFLLMGAWLWMTVVRVFQKLEKLTVLLLLRLLHKLTLKSFTSNVL